VVLDWLINGAIGGAVVSLVAFVLSRFVHDVIGRVWLAFVLVAAAFFYLTFASRADAGTAWLIGEVVGIVIYGGMGVLGIRRSPMWLAAGWALHPVWDMLLHHVGPGRSFTPEAYPISCVSWISWSRPTSRPRTGSGWSAAAGRGCARSARCGAAL
jgi:hypothetical protein